MLLVKNVEIDFGDGLIYAFVSILMVFFILFLISFIVSFFKKMKVNEKKIEEKNLPKVSYEKKIATMDDIVDDDMMVAALIATIDYASEIKEDVHLVSIREIK